MFTEFFKTLTCKLCQVRCSPSTLKKAIRLLHYWPTYIGERRTTFAQAYQIKVRCYGEHVEEQIGNLMRTHWELKGNIAGTHWEQGNFFLKSLLPSPFPLPHPPNLKGKKPRHLECMLWAFPIGCIKFLFPKEFITIFWPGLIIPLGKEHPTYSKDNRVKQLGAENSPFWRSKASITYLSGNGKFWHFIVRFK
jgi:hypothetical protein